MLILMIVLLVTAGGAALIAQIRNDGYGARQGPRSHYDSFDPHTFVR